MKGRIKTYKDDKGFGFIIGEDDSDYFFHISDVRTIIEVKRGQIVEFEPSSNEKGNNAKNITISTESTNKSKIYEIKGKRFKASNIKEYGVSTTTLDCVIVYNRKILGNPNSFLNTLSPTYTYEPSGKYCLYDSRSENLDGLHHRIRYFSDGEVCCTQNRTDSASVMETEARYLYITTYQGDNSYFYERDLEVVDFKDGIDIEAELAKLDALFE